MKLLSSLGCCFSEKDVLTIWKYDISPQEAREIDIIGSYIMTVYPNS